MVTNITSRYCNFFCTGRTIIVDWAVPKSVFTTNESSTKEEIEIKEEDPDDVEETVNKTASDVEGCDIQPIEIKNEPLSDESKKEEEEEESDSDRKSDTSESSGSEEEDEEAVEDRDE
jgi:hypothetical protein